MLSMLYVQHILAVRRGEKNIKSKTFMSQTQGDSLDSDDELKLSYLSCCDVFNNTAGLRREKGKQKQIKG